MDAADSFIVCACSCGHVQMLPPAIADLVSAGGTFLTYGVIHEFHGQPCHYHATVI